MKKKIALLTGGFQSEAIVSVKSAEQTAQFLDKEKYEVYTVFISKTEWFVKVNEDKFDIDKNDFSFLLNGNKINFDYAFIMIHGTPGEDGKMQAYFDLINLPYSTGSFFNTALTFNKHACKLFLKEYGILSANSYFIRKNEDIHYNDIIEKLELPLFVKPNQAGSSFGISKVKQENELAVAIQKAFEEDNEVIIEEFIEGVEVTCGVLKTKNKDFILPLTEIVSKNEFFDYEAKYITGKADEITPARISDEMRDKIQDISSRIYDYTNCEGIVRIDFIIKNNTAYFIEVNTVPGMSANSIIPQQVRASEIKISDFLDRLIDDCIN